MRPVHLSLWFGVLKFKHRRYLRSEEWRGEVPVWRLGKYIFVWRPRGR